MKKMLLLFSVFLTINSFAQDTAITKQKIDEASKLSNEIGLNTTLLLKQIFNLSNNTFPTLPYDLTYKLIKNKSALRIGLGITMTNSSVETTTSSTSTFSTTSTAPSPDATVPVESKSTNLFYRVGWERRYMLNKYIGACWGIDMAGQYGTSYSQSSNGFNNLPFSYSFTKSTDKLTLLTYGGGPMVGIQVFFAKHISVYTEVPIYFMLEQQKDVSETYQHSYSSSNGWNTTTNTQTQMTKGTTLNITLPVTLYLAIKF